MLNRRGFIGLLAGAAIAPFLPAVTLNGQPWPEPADLSKPAFTSEFLRKGDVFTIQGRYALHPVTGKPTAHLQQFVVTSVVGGSASIAPSLR